MVWDASSQMFARMTASNTARSNMLTSSRQHEGQSEKEGCEGGAKARGVKIEGKGNLT